MAMSDSGIESDSSVNSEDIHYQLNFIERQSSSSEDSDSSDAFPYQPLIETDDEDVTEDVGPSYNRYVNYTVSDPYNYDPNKHYGPDVQTPYHKKLIERFNTYKNGAFKFTAKQLLDIWNYKSANHDLLYGNQTNLALLPGYPHIGPGNPIYYKSYNALDDIAHEHDISYSKAKSPLDIYNADRKMLRRLEETEVDGWWAWMCKQIATEGIKYKHQFELQWGVMYPKFTPEQLQFMRDNYPHYNRIMDEVEQRNKDQIKAITDYNPLQHSRFWTYIAQNSQNPDWLLQIQQKHPKVTRYVKVFTEKMKTMATKINAILSDGGLSWKDPFLSSQQEWARRYHEQLESNFVSNPKNYKEMYKIHTGFYNERESYWRTRLSILKDTPFNKTDDKELKQLEADINNLDDIEYKAQFNYMNYNDRGWGHAFSYDIFWELTEYHNNQFKHWLSQTYTNMVKQRNEFHTMPRLQPLLSPRDAADNASINTRSKRSNG